MFKKYPILFSVLQKPFTVCPVRRVRRPSARPPLGMADRTGGFETFRPTGGAVLLFFLNLQRPRLPVLPQRSFCCLVILHLAKSEVQEKDKVYNRNSALKMYLCGK